MTRARSGRHKHIVKGRVRRGRFALAVGSTVGVFVVSLDSGSALAAAKTTKQKTSKAPKPVSGTGDRLRPDYSTLPTQVAVRRAAKARGARAVSGYMKFVQPNPDGSKGQFLFQGSVDFARRTADIKFSLEGVAENYLFVGDEAFQKVAADRVELMGGSWIRSTPDDDPRPTAAIVMDVAFATPDIVATVANWKEKSTAADKAKKLRRLSGSGLISALTTFNPDRFEPMVPVEVLVNSSGLLAAVQWRLVPTDVDETVEPVEPIEFSNKYGPLKTPLIATAPEDDVVEYAEAGRSAPVDDTAAA
jgi:hypothetical protein